MVGAGYIAVELAGILNALGSETSLLIRKEKVWLGFPLSISLEFECLFLIRCFAALIPPLAI